MSKKITLVAAGIGTEELSVAIFSIAYLKEICANEDYLNLLKEQLPEMPDTFLSQENLETTLNKFLAISETVASLKANSPTKGSAHKH